MFKVSLEIFNVHDLCGSLEFSQYITNVDLEDFLEAFRERDVDEKVDRTVSGEE